MRQPVHATPRPLATASLRDVRGIFSDVDGTLTRRGQLTSEVLAQLEALKAAGLRVVLVTGRPAGWGECFLRTLPVDGVIVENGGLYFSWGRGGRLKKVYARAEARRGADRQKLTREVQRMLKRHPGLRLSTDSAYTEVDLALDYNEEAALGREVAEDVVAELTRRGVSAVRSSVHVNCWLGNFDKRTMVERFLAREWGERQPAPGRYLYVGDSLNDAPMFAAFPLSVGVANVLEVLDELDHPPAYVTRAPEGEGFVELARALLERRATT
jgi:HAD superfamily hydrolase (TIGR01484 family)